MNEKRLRRSASPGLQNDVKARGKTILRFAQKSSIWLLFGGVSDTEESPGCCSAMVKRSITSASIAFTAKRNCRYESAGGKKFECSANR